MRRRVLLMLLVATGCIAGGAHLARAAEASGTQREAMQMKLEELRERLALTPEQEAKIAPLVQARNEKLKALRSTSSPSASRREKRQQLQKVRAIQQEFVSQVEPLLTSEQKKEWEKIRSEMRESARERYRNR
ncbi:MAG: hypothetical protein IRZ28_10045 [Steroidobacteraceae bacterium]|nr:hypothetical protein [Steroidobacteraceae bacterium]